MNPIFVSQYGLVTSIGRDADYVAAAIRAGISRPHGIDQFQLVDPTTMEPMPLIGHPIHGFTEGFNLIGLWLRVVGGAVDDLLSRLSPTQQKAPRFWEDAALIAATPYLDGDRFLVKEPPPVDTLRKAYLEPLAQQLALPIPLARYHLVSKGHASVAHALLLARDLLQTAGISRVLIVAADSYLDALTLEWLAANRRLKSPENPAGLAPGEAGACLLVTNRQESENVATISGAATTMSSPQTPTDNQNVGQGLSDAIHLSLTSANMETIFQGDIVSDQNGEFWRAQEFSHARLLARSVLSMHSRLILPAVSLGDTGAASGAISICVALRALRRAYSTSAEVLSLSSTERGDHAAMLIQTA